MHTYIHIYASKVNIHRTEGKIDSVTIIVGHFNTPFSIHDRTSRLHINKEIKDLNSTTNQIYLRDIYRIFYPIAAGYTFFSSIHGYFSEIDYTFGHKKKKP